MTFERFFGQDIDPEKAVQLFNIHHLYYAIFLVITYIVTLKFAAKIKASAKEHTYKTYAFIFLAFLETTSNPLILSMGDKETATQRLNLAQAFNPIGSLTGMIIAQVFVIDLMDYEFALPLLVIAHSLY